MGNVTAVLTTLPAGTDSQAYCYDEQNRLVWASSASATGPCGAANTAGSLSGAAYTQIFGYDTPSPASAPAAHPTYTASYNAAG